MIWKKIQDYNYEISKDVIDFGDGVYQPLIMSPFGKILNFDVDIDGYYRINMRKNGKLKHFKVHRLYAKAFIPNTLNKSCIDHINRIKTDNRLDNLRWATISENSINKKKWGHIRTAYNNQYRACWCPIPQKLKTKTFKTYEEAKAFLDSKQYDINGCEI